MTLTCNCDMPIEIYADWLQDQGWDCEELRDTDSTFGDWMEFCNMERRWRGNGSVNLNAVFMTPSYLDYEGGNGRKLLYEDGVGDVCGVWCAGNGEQDAGDGVGLPC